MEIYALPFKLISLVNTIIFLLTLIKNRTEDDSDEKQLDVGMLILKDKLIYYHVEVFTGNWKSGNWLMLVWNSSMGFLIKNKFFTK